MPSLSDEIKEMKVEIKRRKEFYKLNYPTKIDKDSAEYGMRMRDLGKYIEQYKRLKKANKILGG